MTDPGGDPRPPSTPQPDPDAPLASPLNADAPDTDTSAPDPHPAPSDDAPPAAPPAPLLVPPALMAQHGPHPSPKAPLTDAVSVARGDRSMRASQRVERRSRDLARQRKRLQRERAEARLRWAERVVWASTLAVVFGAPLAIGAVHTVTLAPLAALGALATVGAVALAWRRDHALALGPAGWTLVALTLVTCLQATPLPIALIDLLSPQAAAWIRASFAGALGAPPSHAALSLNVSRTLQAALAMVAALGVYTVAYNRARDRLTFQRALMAAPLLGVALVAVGAAQRAAGTSARLFVYTPEQLEHAPFFAASFVNPDHLGALLATLSLVALGLSLSPALKAQRSAWALAFGACVVGMVLSLSLAAAAAWAAGLATFGVLAARRRLARSAPLRVASLGAVAGLSLGVYGAWTHLQPKLAFLTQRQGLPLLEHGPLWARGLDLAAAFPLTGVGRGGVSDALSASPPPLAEHYAFLGNSWLQLLTDYGLFAGAAAALVLLASVARLGLRRAWKADDDALMAALFAAMVCASVAALSGFSADIPGVALPLTFVLALALGRDAHYRHARAMASAERRGDPHPSPPRRWRWAATAALLAPLLAVAPLTPAALDAALSPPDDALDALTRADIAPPPSPDAIRDATRAALRLRPASARTQLRAALAWRRRGDAAQTQAALDQAARLDLASPIPWILMGRWAHADGDLDRTRHAWKHGLERALRVGGRAPETLALELGRTLQEPSDVAALLPPNPTLWRVVLQTALHHGDPAAAARHTRALADALLTHHRASLHAQPSLRPIADTFIALSDARLGRTDDARLRLDAALASKLAPPEAWRAAVALDAASSSPKRALTRCADALAAYPDDTALLLTHVDLLIQHHASLRTANAPDNAWDTQVDALLRKLRPTVLRDPRHRPRFYLLSGLASRVRGNTPLAIRDLQRAADAAPDDPTPLLALAQALHSEREYDALRDAYRRFLARFPDHPAAPLARAELERALRAREDIDARLRWDSQPQPPPPGTPPLRPTTPDDP